MTAVLYELVKNNNNWISLNMACSAVGMSKGSYFNQATPKEVPNEFLGQIKEIIKEFPRYGYRPITKELHRRSIIVNHKKVLKTMEKHGLTRKMKRFRVCTTNSKHGLPVYPNLVKDIAIVRLNQVWASDITYIHMLHGFAYLAVIIDLFSRKCIGWQLSRNIDEQLCLDALDMAFNDRKETNLNGLIHHSDQGSQYASNEYIAKLEGQGIIISMSRKGNAYDNAHTESFIKTVKYDEIYMNEYIDFNDAYNNIEQFIKKVYNKKRLHSSIGYLPPAEFEEKILKKMRA